MYTIKIENESDGVCVLEALGWVSIITEGQAEWTAVTEPCRRAGDSPRAVIQYTAAHAPGGPIYLFDDDRAWIMNANGKTVASI